MLEHPLVRQNRRAVRLSFALGMALGAIVMFIGIAIGGLL